MKTQSEMRAESTLNSVSRRRSGVGRVFKPGRLFNRRLRNSPAITRIGSPASPYLHQSIAPLPVFANVADRPTQVFGGRRVGDECLRFAACDFQYFFVANDVGDPQRRQPGLFGSEKFSRPPQL